MSGFGFRRDEDEIGVGSPLYSTNYQDEKTQRRVEFRCTMKKLNQSFVNACQDEITRAPDCVLVPLIQNYLLYLRDTLKSFNEDSSDLDANSFTNIGKFYDTITKKLHRFSYPAVFNNNNKELPPLKRRAESDIVHCSGSPTFNNPNAPSHVSTPLPGAFFNRLSSNEGKRIILTPSMPKISESPQRTETNAFSGLGGFSSAAGQVTSSPNYFIDNSKQPINAAFMGSGSSKSPSSFNLPSSGKPTVGSPQANSTPVFKKSPNLLNRVEEDSTSSFSSPRMSNSNSFITHNKTSPARSAASPAVFSSQNAFGLSSNYTNGISPSLAPIIPKAGGFDMGASKPFMSSPQGFSTQQPNSEVKPLTGFSFAPAVPFSMSTPQPTVNNKDSDDEDAEPPKNEFTPVVEPDSLYNIRCKVYYIVDGAYKDKGVGQLYVKKLSPGKYQLVVRADNTLGIVILNLLLSKSLPLSKKSERDIMTVDPNGNKGEPATVLIRVKDESAATALLNKLTEFKSSSA